MGVVYRGVDPVIGRHVAIKTLRPEDLGESAERGSMGDRLMREARSAGILSHPSIVTIYQAGQDKDILYIAMEFVDGANLADILAQGRLNTEAMLKILKQSAEALDYAHSKGVVHRDIKPGNLLLEPSGKVKIADFGIAKLNQAGVTKTTSSVGSPAYMSPEHVRAQSIDGRADQYSLGVMTYEMLTGRRPHDSEELTSLVFKVVFEPPDLSLVLALPKGAQLEPIFAKVLSKAAEDRYASCMEFYEALGRVLDENARPAIAGPKETAVAVQPGPQPPVSPSPSGHHHMPTVVVNSGFKGSDPVSALPPPPPVQPAGKGKLYAGVGVLAVVLLAGGYFAMKPAAGGGGGGTTGGPTGSTGPSSSTGETDPLERPSPPVLIQQTQCSYTPTAGVAEVHGNVGLSFDVTETGEVDNIGVTKSVHKELDERAKECVKTWRFQPAKLKNGKSVRFHHAGGEIAF